MPSFDAGDGVDGYPVAIGCHREALPRKVPGIMGPCRPGSARQPAAQPARRRCAGSSAFSVIQQRGQPAQAAGRARLHGPERDIEPRRDLGLGMAAEVGKLEYRALLRG